MQREHKALAWHAWHVAALYRAKKMPPLSDLTGDKDVPSERQSWEDQRNIARMINSMFGGQFVKREANNAD